MESFNWRYFYNRSFVRTRYANGTDSPQGVFDLNLITIRAAGKMEALTADDSDAQMFIKTANFTVNGAGYFRTNRLWLHSHYLDVDLTGIMHADYSGEAANSGPGIFKWIVFLV